MTFYVSFGLAGLAWWGCLSLEDVERKFSWETSDVQNFSHGSHRTCLPSLGRRVSGNSWQQVGMSPRQHTNGPNGSRVFNAQFWPVFIPTPSMFQFLRVIQRYLKPDAWEPLDPIQTSSRLDTLSYRPSKYGNLIRIKQSTSSIGSILRRTCRHIIKYTNLLSDAWNHPCQEADAAAGSSRSYGEPLEDPRLVL